MTTSQAMSQLVQANPKLNYCITEDTIHRWNELSKSYSGKISYFIHVNFGNDGAGMKETKCINGPSLENLVAEAVTFIKA